MNKYMRNLCVIVMMFFCCPCFSLTFREMDLEKLILQYPLMSYYDSKSGYFNNTAYQLYDVNKLKEEVRELNSELEILNDRNTKLTSQNITLDGNEEDIFWSNVSKDYKRKKDLEYKILEKINFINSDGRPGYDKLFDIVSKMTKDVIFPLYENNSLTVNKLPKFYFTDDKNKKEINKLFNYNNSDSLKQYIARAETFGSIFPNSDKNILYNKNENVIENVATIDLGLALMLHPKMALYDFSRLGFKQYGFGLSENEIDEYEEKLNSNHKNNTELEYLKNELNNLYSRKVNIYKNMTGSYTYNEIIDFLKEFPKKEKELLFKIIDAEYIESNPDLSTPEDSIKIIKNIYNDIDCAIKDVLKEKGINFALNSTLPIDPGYNLKYPFYCIKGLGYAGINYIIFYSFYNDNHLNGPYRQQINDFFHRRRYELINYKFNYPQYVLPLIPYPTIISGGTNILAEVIKKIYKKYNIDSSAYLVFDSVIEKIEVFQYGGK